MNKTQLMGYFAGYMQKQAGPGPGPWKAPNTEVAESSEAEKAAEDSAYGQHIRATPEQTPAQQATGFYAKGASPAQRQFAKDELRTISDTRSLGDTDERQALTAGQRARELVPTQVFDPLNYAAPTMSTVSKMDARLSSPNSGLKLLPGVSTDPHRALNANRYGRPALTTSQYAKMSKDFLADMVFRGGK